MKVNLQLGDEALIALRDIGHAAAREQDRLSLTDVCIEVTKHHVWAVTTNSYILAIRHIAELAEGRKQGFRVLIPAKALTAAAKASYKRAPDARRRARNPLTRAVTILPEGIEFATDEGSVSVGADTERTYPDWLSIVNGAVKRTPEATMRICLNAELVAQLGRALGADARVDPGLQIEFMGAGDAAFVGPRRDQRSFGLLMPIMDQYARDQRAGRLQEQKRQLEEQERERQERLARRRERDRARRAAKRTAA